MSWKLFRKSSARNEDYHAVNAWFGDVIIAETVDTTLPKEKVYVVVGDGIGHSYLLQISDTTPMLAVQNVKDLFVFDYHLNATIRLCNETIGIKKVIRDGQYSMLSFTPDKTNKFDIV
jgi:hypothetical protein